MLDFWRDFDPQTRFVLLHTPAAQVLAKAASQAEETSSFDAQAVLRAWCAYHEQLLHFFHRHRDRCTWVHHDPSRISACDWLATLPEEWGLRRERQDDPSDGALGTAEPNEVDTLLLSLSTQAVLQDEAVSTLQSEIWASLPACPESLEDTTQRHGQLDALQTLRLVQSVALGGRRELQQNLQAAQARQAAEALANSKTQARLQTRLAAKELECYNLQERLNTEAQARADAQMRITTETQARESLQAQLDAQTKACAEASQESELLLTQLHQVQEELESHFLQREQAQQQSQQLQARLDAEAKAKSDAQSKLNAEIKARADLQARLDAEAKAKSDAQSKLNAEIKARADLQARLDMQARAHNEATQEGELLLAQLHQVQEELEHYFLQHQQAQHASQQLQARLQRWASRYPDHCEWDTLAVLPQIQGDQQTILISGLHHSGRTLGQVQVGLRHANDQATLVLTRQGDLAPPLMAWTDAAAELTLPLPTREGAPQSDALARLTPSDLQLLHALCSAVATHLPANTPGAASWATRWQEAATTLQHLPRTWRFDTLRLRHEQVNPDYEHLWLHFDNAQYGSRHWPQFELRLSASHVRKKTFSHLPKLEFPLPEQGLPKQFENWFEESEDDKGTKFELRFDIKTPGLDIGCWNALSADDQSQLLALVQQMPAFLQQLEKAGTSIHRPWADWHGLISGIKRTLVTCLAIEPHLVGHEAVSNPALV